MELCKAERAEMLVYKMLGVKLFRKAILLFEKIKHFKDGLSNANYHPKGLSACTLKSFSGYLVYNAMLHVASLFLTAVYFAVSALFKINYVPVNILMAVAAVFNIYCIMLQRYIYLSIKAHLCRAQKRNDRLVREMSEQIKAGFKARSEAELAEEFELVKRLHDSSLTGCDCLITDSDAEILERIGAGLNRAPERVHPQKTGQGEKRTLSEVFFSSKDDEQVNSAVVRRVSRLQKLLGVNDTYNVLFDFSVVTQSPQAEAAYRKLFPNDSRNSVEMMISALLASYQSITERTGAAK